MIEIVQLEKDFVIIYKPAGMPSQPDPSGDTDAMSETSRILLDKGENGRLWLIHRLDRTVSGLLAFARNARTAAELSRLVATSAMGKQYLAVVNGEPQAGIYRDFVYKDARLSKAFVVDRERRGVKLAELECTPIATREGKTLCRVALHTGRYHQIRVQLASRGCPIIGDGKYGSRDKGSRYPALHAYRLDFELPGRRTEALYLPNTSEYPWSLFAAEISSSEVER